MTLIKQRDAIVIFINSTNTISIVHPEKEKSETGRTKDIVLTDHSANVDVIVNARQRLKKEYYENYEITED